ncbi:MAG TPA: DUF4870 domain-containing protein [Tepidisphaeraceae bacterium]|jgi:hypothetical protein
MTQGDFPPNQPTDPSPNAGPMGAGSTSPSTPPTPPGAGTPIVGYDTGAIETNPDARLWGMLAHLSSLVMLLSIPPILGPLVVWLMKKDQMPFVNDQGKESLNFQITVLIAILISIPLVCLGGIGIFIMIAVGVAALVLAIIAGIQANNGVAYRYPMTLRLVK